MRAPPRPRVLHLDDDPAARFAVARVLRRAGLNVLGAASGEEGLEIARRGRLALVVLDVDLPGISGFEVSARLRADSKTRTLPILYLSAARADVRDRVRGYEGGADAYLVQPVAPEELVAVARVLVQRGRERAGRAGRAGGARGDRAASGREEALAAAVRVLRAPLSSIAINAASLVQTAGDAVSRARATAVAEGHVAIERILATLGELAHLESRPAALPLEPVALETILADVARRLALAAQERGVSVSVAAGTGPTIRCDPHRLGRAVEAFALAAIDAAHGGADVGIGAEVDRADARFTIRPAPGAAAVLEPAAPEGPWPARLPADARTLELALARAIVHAHGGRVVTAPDGAALHVEVPASGPAVAGEALTARALADGRGPA